MRNAFVQELVELADKNPKIALVVGDLGYSVIEPFANKFPDRFINAGVAEQNMTGLAAGMASEGYHVFTYSIANFPTYRCAEQIRNDIDYHNLAVTVVAVGGGLAYGPLGYSHHAIQDYALIRTMPNMLIAAPGDPMETRACMRYLTENPGPSYLRLAKAGEPSFHQDIPVLEPGRLLRVRVGDSKKAIFTTGAGLQAGIKLICNREYSDYSLFTLPLWSMNTKAVTAEFLRQFNHVVTIEDHLYDGGFGSWLLETKACNKSITCDIRLIALDSIVCGLVGSQEALNRLGGIS